MICKVPGWATHVVVDSLLVSFLTHFLNVLLLTLSYLAAFLLVLKHCR